jgi:periplasmic divalent cation tolerance protein
MRIVYVTAKDTTEAERIARMLVENRLAACVNILGAIQSCYWWKDAVQTDSEVALIAKTRESLVCRCITAIKHIHSYSCPCIVALPVVDGYQPFIQWIHEETSEE